MSKPMYYWTKERCKEVSLKCNSKNEFRIKYSRAYENSRINKWLNEICSHMVKTININKLPKHSGYWKIKENCITAALECKTKKEFREKYSSGYKVAKKEGWLDELCLHMIISNNKPFKYWTKEKCKEVSLNCKRRNEFQKKYPTAYEKSRKNNWLDDFCSHMVETFNDSKRIIYLYEFSDNYVYIGLTDNFNRRKIEHNKNGKTTVSKHIKQTGLIPNYKLLTDYIDINEACEQEAYYINFYKELGYNILNVVKSGGLGGNYLKWNYENCKLEASKYKNSSEFRKNKIGAYESCLKHKWIDEFYPKNKKTS